MSKKVTRRNLQAVWIATPLVLEARTLQKQDVRSFQGRRSRGDRALTDPVRAGRVIRTERRRKREED